MIGLWIRNNHWLTFLRTIDRFCPFTGVVSGLKNKSLFNHDACDDSATQPINIMTHIGKILCLLSCFALFLSLVHLVLAITSIFNRDNIVTMQVLKYLCGLTLSSTLGVTGSYLLMRKRVFWTALLYFIAIMVFQLTAVER